MNKNNQTIELTKEPYEAPHATSFILEHRANVLVGFSDVGGGIENPELQDGEGDSDYASSSWFYDW